VFYSVNPVTGWTNLLDKMSKKGNS